MKPQAVARREHGSTFVDILRKRALEQPSRRVFTLLEDGETETRHLDFAGLDRQARAIAATLQRYAAAGERALLLYPFGLDYAAAFFGALYAGVVAVPVYPPDPTRLHRTLPRLRAIAQDAQATLVLTLGSIRDLVDGLASHSPELASLRWVATDDIAPGSEAEWRPADVTSSSLAFIQYTSGSTAVPKGVLLTHGNLLHNAAIIQRAFGSTEDSVGVSWLPMYHDMGLIGCVLQPVYAGFRIVLMPPESFLQKPVRWLQAISRYRGTLSGGPNFAFDLCARKVTLEQREALDLSSWRYAFNAAEPVRPDTLERFTRHFAPAGFRPDALRPLYGLAEATLMVTGGFPGARRTVRTVDGAALESWWIVELPEGTPGSRRMVGLGRSWLEQQVIIVDPVTRTRCAPDRVGEIWVSGPSVAQGYWNRPEETEHTFRAWRADTEEGPWLRTGDLGFLQDGELFFAGRIKDLVIIRGRNHYPQDLERTVEESHPALRPGCGAAFSIDSGQEERLVIVQEVHRDREGDSLEDIAHAARQSVAAAHGIHLDTLVLVRHGSVPKTSSGKIQRNACRQEFLAGTLDVLHTARLALPRAEPSDASPSGFLREQLARLIGIAPEALDPTRTLAELGLDSMRQLELQQLLESRYALGLSQEELLRHPLGQLLEELGTRKPRAESGPFAIAWDVARDAPALWRYLREAQPWVAEELERMKRDIPVPPTNGTFDTEGFFRPQGHFRSFYRRGPGESVLAIKGAEVRCDDQLGFLQLLQQRLFERFAKHSVTNTLEYFLIQERKVPGALTLPEALNEAQHAAEVQSRFLEEFHEPGGVPLPLLVVRWSEDVVARFRARLLPLLSGFTLTIAQGELRDGLACYVYWFPKAPFPRVSHFAGSLAQESQRTGSGGFANTRLVYATLKHNLDPEAVVDSWVKLAARLLLLGYFPSDIQHFKNGQCIEPQNVLLNGTFADLDSVIPMRQLGSDREFYASFLAMLNLLAHTVRVFLTAESNGTTTLPSPFPAQFQRPDFMEMLSVLHIWERLKVHLREQRHGLRGTLDARLEELVSSNLSFPVLFEKVMFSLYYAGPTLPESAVHLLSIADVYNDVGSEDRRPARKVEYSPKLSVDAAALATLPRAFLEQLRLSPREFIRDCLHGDASLVSVYETFLGRIGLIVLPLEDATLYVDKQRTVDAVVQGLEEAARLGADTVSLTGLVPSATDYGRSIQEATSGRSGLPRLTTGHATTAACFVMMVEQVLRAGGRRMEEESVALLGAGSIGTAILRLMLRSLPHPRGLRLCDVPAKREHLTQLTEELVTELGFRGKVEVTFISGSTVPEEVYSASVILSATSAANLVEVDRLRPGTLVVDDSAPHCFDPRRAIRRFQERRDVLFTEAGAIRSHRPVGEIREISFATGWDHKIRAALKLLHPIEDTLMGCVFSSILSSRFEDAPCLVGTPTPRDLDLHYRKLRELKFEAARLYVEDYVLDEDLVGMFRSRFGSGPR
ncbi:AMP-binding protein [Vitiosangium sp. GDMCC 1.1324]|uniref:AMP-binding protein n=1 Tax=Vitiosangium sp. (strain GDMCC 1.1324) TaxID=2138576 RepID=UPI00130E2348|nr:AMP-binding protein [Vitiosangium sp. GDMCC 1.1324]